MFKSNEYRSGESLSRLPSRQKQTTQYAVHTRALLSNHVLVSITDARHMSKTDRF
jgi:hypothetical protein